VVRELCGLVLEKYQGLLTLGRWAIYFGLVISAVISVISLLPKIRSFGHQWRTIKYLNAADRGITLTLLVFLLLMMVLIRNYPVRLSRNVILHAGLFTVFFISNTVVGLFYNLFGTQLYQPISTGLMAISSLCVLAWLFFLRPEGEEVRLDLPHFTPEHEERILDQLNALNTTLLRVAGNKRKCPAE
jgi:hypothetical protein